MAALPLTPSPRKFLLSDLPYLSLLVLMVAAPFERVKPAFTLLGMELTNLEVVLSTALLLWFIFSVTHRRRLQFQSPITWPSLLLLVVMLLSTWIVATHPGEALRFCGRFTAGLLIYYFVLNEVTHQSRLLGMLSATFFTGAFVAVLGILEYFHVPLLSQWLAAFKTGPSYVGGQLRISSTLQYPTIASMYLEITFGLGIGLLLYALARNRVRLAIFIFLCLSLTAEGILLTQTRAGWFTLPIQLVAVIGLYWIRIGVDRGFRVLLALVVVMAALFGQRLIYDPMFWLRLTTSSSQGWYRAQFEVSTQLKLSPGELQQIPITVTNIGKVTWNPGGEGEFPFHLSYHWLDPEENKVLVFEGLRTPFPRTVRPGEKVQVQAQVLAPPRPGRYRLAWDVAQEGLLWFSTEEHLEDYSEALVEGPTVEGELRMIPVPEPRFHLARFTLWWAAGQMLFSHPLLGVGPDNFRFLYGHYLDLEKWDHRLHSNNMYLEFFVGTGLLGGLLFLWLCFRIFGTLKQIWQRFEKFDFILFLGVAAACLVVALHGLIDYFLVFTPTYIIIWMTWAAAEVVLSNREQD